MAEVIISRQACAVNKRNGQIGLLCYLWFDFSQRRLPFLAVSGDLNRKVLFSPQTQECEILNFTA